MEQAQTGKFKFKNILKAACQAAETFFYVFFMMAQLIIFTSNLVVWDWVMPLFVVPSCVVCLTLGADYWISENRIRLQAYWISNIVTVILLVPLTILYMGTSGTSSAIRFFATILLPVLLTFYSIWKVRKTNRNGQLLAENKTETRIKRTHIALRKMNVVLSLVSISCVLLESSHRAISNIYHFILTPPDFVNLNTLVPFALTILTAILLARFVKAEFAPREISSD